jgi:hypothetical protein
VENSKRSGWVTARAGLKLPDDLPTAHAPQTIIIKELATIHREIAGQ